MNIDFDSVLAAARAGEGWAFDELYGTWNGPMTAFVRSRGVADVDEVVSETFLGAFRSIGSFSGDERAFRAWLYRIARNKMADEFRRSARRPAATSLDEVTDAELPGSRSDVEAETAARLGSTRVMELLDLLTEEQREVLVLRVIADLTIDQIAEITGRRRGAVKQLQRRALRRLEKELDRPGFRPESSDQRPSDPYPSSESER